MKMRAAAIKSGGTSCASVMRQRAALLTGSTTSSLLLRPNAPALLRSPALVMVRMPETPIGVQRMTIHSSAHPRALFGGLFGGSSSSKQEEEEATKKTAAAGQQSNDGNEEALSEEEAARLDEAEATAVVDRAAGFLDAANPWSPVVELPIESFLNAELKAPLGTVSLNPNIFLVPIRRDILHRVVVWQLAKRRQGTHKSKSRAEVRGGGRKPRPQKGSGRSRQGSIRSPLWRGGGHAHAKKPRSYDFPLLKKVRKLGLKMALSLKLAQGKLRVVRSTDVDEAKTKNLVKVIETKDLGRTLVIDGKTINQNFRRASQNLHSVKLLSVDACNVFDILNHEFLVLSLDAVQHLEERLLESDEPVFYDYKTFTQQASKEQTVA